MLVLRRGRDVLLEKRLPSGICGGLWCLPQFDAIKEAKLDAHTAGVMGENKSPFGRGSSDGRNWERRVTNNLLPFFMNNLFRNYAARRRTCIT